MDSSLLKKHNTTTVLQLSSDLKVINFSPESFKPFGYDISFIINKKITSLLEKDSKKLLSTHINSLQSSTKKKSDIDVKLITAKNKVVWYNLVFEKINDKLLGQGFIVIATNINASKLREEKLHLQLETKDKEIATLINKYQTCEAIVKNANAIIVALDVNNKVCAISKYTQSFTGFKASELIGKDSLDAFAPKNKYLQFHKKVNEYRKTGKFPSPFEGFILTKNGTEKIISWMASPLIIDGKVCGRVSIGKDITEIKNKEKELVKREFHFRRIAENIPLPVCVCNKNGDVISLNKKFVEIIGYSLNDMPTLLEAFKFIKPINPDLVNDEQSDWHNLTKALKNQELDNLPTIERIIICKNGSEKYFDVSFSLDSNILCIVFNDVTLKTSANKVLKNQREFYENILNNIPSDVAVFDNQHRYIYVNPIGIKDPALREWIIGKTNADYCKYRNKPMLIAEHRQQFFNKVMETKTLQSWEELIQNDNGTTEYHLRNMYPVLNEAGEVTIVIGYGINITDRKQAESKLIESEKRFKRIADNTPIPICNFDREMNVVYINKKFLDIIGYSFEDVRNATSWPHFIFYPDAVSAENGRLEWLSAVENKWKFPKSKASVLERTIVCKNGDHKIFEISFTIHNKLVYAILNEITERKAAEKLLFESEQRFKALVENMPIAIGCHNVDGQIIFLNKHFINTIGYNNNEIPTLKDWYNITQPDTEIRDILYNHWHETIDAYRKGTLTTIPYIETSIVCKNGDSKTFNFLFSIYNDNVYIMLVDITERKKAEQELINSHLQLRELASHLQKVREEERKYIAREIHDELGQLVTGLKMDISLAKRKLDKQVPEMSEKLSDIMNITDSIVHTVRRIASELRPSILDDIGLDAALEWQAKEFEKRTNISCLFSNNAKDILVPVDVKSNLFRIFQESLTNIIRHANATKVMVSLNLKNSSLFFTVTDNGNGFNNVSPNRTFGLLGMKERVIMINGTFEIESAAGNGTSIKIIVPLY